MHLGLKTALCASYSDAKSWEPWSFTEVPDCPQTQAPNIVWIQIKGVRIILIRDDLFPQPSYICLSKVLVNEPLQAPQWGPLWRELPISRSFFDISLELLSISLPTKKSHPSLKGPRKGASPHVPQNGILMAHFQSTPLRILQGPQYRRSPPGSPHTAPIEMPISRALLHPSLKVPGK